MSRSSTVLRVSATMLRNLIAFCDTHHCGVILRCRGVELGFTADDLADLLPAVLQWTVGVYTRKGWDSRYFGFPDRVHYVHDAYDPHDALDDVLAYARSIGGAELVESVTSDPLYQLLN
jgi:hypothetical protein